MVKIKNKVFFVLALVLCLSCGVILGCSDNSEKGDPYAECKLEITSSVYNIPYSLQNNGKQELTFAQSSGVVYFTGKLIYTYNGINYEDELKEDLGYVELDKPGEYTFDIKFDKMPQCEYLSFEGELRVSVIANSFPKCEYGEKLDIYVPRHHSKIFWFYPKLESDYRIVTDENCSVGAYKYYDGDTGLSGAVTPNDDGLFHFYYDTLYYINVGNDTNDTIHTELGVEIAAPDITSGDYNMEDNYAIFSLPVEKKCFYDFASTIDSMWISVLVIDNSEESHIKVLDSHYKEVRFEKNDDREMYITVERFGDKTEPSVFSCSTGMEINFVAINPVDSLYVVNGICDGLPTPMQNTGYEFAGWWRESDFSGNAFILEDLANINEPRITLYAEEVPIEYTLHYELYGGTGVDDTIFTINNLFKLPTPSKDGCVFVGWYDSPEFSGRAVTWLERGTYGDKTLYARWADETYTLSEFDINQARVGNCKITMNGSFPVTVNYGEHFELPTLSCEGFKFEGWYYVDSDSIYGDIPITDSEGYSRSPYGYVGAIALKAHWSIEYIIWKPGN